MDKNYYEILEINENASQEIVEKAYKTLAKKYHPDLQEGDKKHEYEEKLKIINEAYETLSDPDKRKEYDASLPKNNISAEDYENLYRQKEYMKQRISRMEQQQRQNQQASSYANPNQQRNIRYQQQQPNIHYQQPQYDPEEYAERLRQQQQYQQKVNDAINKAYQDAYVQDLRNRGYKIKYQKSWKDYLAGLITIVVIIIIFAILWQIPPVRNSLIHLYETNIVVHIVVNFFLSIFSVFSKK